jgi:hypothetical protein
MNILAPVARCIGNLRRSSTRFCPVRIFAANVGRMLTRTLRCGKSVSMSPSARINTLNQFRSPVPRGGYGEWRRLIMAQRIIWLLS